MRPDGLRSDAGPGRQPAKGGFSCGPGPCGAAGVAVRRCGVEKRSFSLSRAQRRTESGWENDSSRANVADNPGALPNASVRNDAGVFPARKRQLPSQRRRWSGGAA